MSLAQPTKNLELTRDGLDPSAVEKWRKQVFAVILSGRGGVAFAGASLAYDRGTIDFEVLKDADCPDHVTAVMANTTFLGMRFAAPLTKGQVYQYTDHWIAAGRPNQYVWPPRDGQPPLAPVEISNNDPCRSVKPLETLTAAQRQRMAQEGRSSEWKHYKRTMDGAFAILQAHMGEALNFAMNQISEYSLAMSSGDLLEVIGRTKIKAICGTRTLAKVVTKAVRNVIDPRETGHHQKESETEEEYTARFKKAVDAAHSLRILGETVTPLSENDCIRGLLTGLRKGFDSEKAHWLLNVAMYGGLEAAIERIKELAEHVPKPEAVAPIGDVPASENQPAAPKRKLETADGETTGQRFRFRRPFQNPSSYSPNHTNAPRAGYSPSQVLIAGGGLADHSDEEETYTADQVQQLIEEAVHDRMVFATQGWDTRDYAPMPDMHGYAPPVWPHYHQYQNGYQRPPHVLQLAAPGRSHQRTNRPEVACRNFVNTGHCSYGNSCKFAHVAEGTRSEAMGRTTSLSSTSPAPARTNPFAAKPN